MRRALASPRAEQGPRFKQASVAQLLEEACVTQAACMHEQSNVKDHKTRTLGEPLRAATLGTSSVVGS